IYLLENAKQTVIPYENILSEVWDKRGLISSYKRLNQVTKELRDKLNQIGLAEDFILTIRSRGYRLKEESITQLYSETIVADS
ncbi:helix-turn-helix domain-containing protein, partial [Serratia sp. DD3]